jgi:hypothetical protein
MTDNKNLVTGFKADVDLTFSRVEHSGELEVSNFSDIDTAFINKIASVLMRLKVSDPDHERNARLAAFAARPIAEKVAMGEFDTAKDFLKSLSKKSLGKVSLPFVYITRDPMIMFAEVDKYADLQGVSEVYSLDDDDNESYVGQVNQSVAVLSYQLNIVGWQNDNIESLSLLLLMWLRHQHTDHAFKAKTQLAGAPFTLDAQIIDRYMATAESASLPFEEDKLRVLSITIGVDAEVAMIKYGTKKEARVNAESSIHSLYGGKEVLPPILRTIIAANTRTPLKYLITFDRYQLDSLQLDVNY